ncbi:MAG TPA: signal peptidase I [Coriobacteriia bacterium]|nr:signal peptidase I [Coriobacteriia bacterium]
MNDDNLDIGPSLLAPGAPPRPDKLARLLVWPLLLLLLVVMLVFYVFYAPLRVAGDSMQPSLHDGDRALRTKSYESPHRGDIVIVDVRTPAEDDDIVKRIVALPGDTVEIRDDIALVNGVAESITHIAVVPGTGVYRKPEVVPDGMVYVLGDNRPVSLDSRYIGVLPLSKIRGRVTFLFLPPDRFGPAH